MKRAVYILFFVGLVSHSAAQVIDTAFAGETATYHVRYHQDGSWLHWETAAGEILSENPSQTDSIRIRWNTTGLHQISVYEESLGLCIGELAKAEILVIENDFEVVLAIPNVFTPNGDDQNDYFTITYNYPPENFQITIVSRWGPTVFQTRDINHSWDGKMSGNECSPGVYYYLIRYNSRGKMQAKEGFVHLIR